MKKFVYFSIPIFISYLYSLLDEYYYICKKCGRNLSNKDNACPYCQEIQKNKSNITNMSPIQILKIRYAKGELTKKEYQDMMQDLK